MQKDRENLEICENILNDALRKINNKGFIMQTYEEVVAGTIVERGVLLDNGIVHSKVPLWNLF